MDCNRAGVPLIEIVTKPIIGAGERAPEVARAYVSALRDLVKALGVSDARMDQGSMRVDSNLSLRPIGQEEFGTRTETKNINSLKSVEQAVRYEMQRQAQVLTDGGFIRQETRHYQETDGSTSAGRIKETAEDYRYFNDPDLPPVIAPREWVEEIRATLPELPWVRRARIQQEWGLKDEEMRDLVNAGALEPIPATVEAGTTADEARAWWVNYLSAAAREQNVELEALPSLPARPAEVVGLVMEGKLTTVGLPSTASSPVRVLLRGRRRPWPGGRVTTAPSRPPSTRPWPRTRTSSRVRPNKVVGAIVAVMKATRK